jgi:DNA-binding response OmpR family regulator
MKTENKSWETSQTILVVDDDPVSCRLTQSVLTARGYQVVATVDASQGLEMAMKQAPALIILDVMLPIINGYNFCRLMKSEKECRRIPIILLTSRANEEDRRIGVEAGANEYLVKPFHTEELLAKVSGILHKTTQSA